MSLYSLEEVCAGCRWARWMKGEKRTAFDFCELKAEESVDHKRGRCDFRAPEHDTGPGEERAE